MNRAQYILEEVERLDEVEPITTFYTSTAVIMAIKMLVHLAVAIWVFKSIRSLEKLASALERANTILKKNAGSDPQLKELHTLIRARKVSVDGYIKRNKVWLESDGKKGTAPSKDEMYQQREDWAKLHDAILAYDKAQKIKDKATKKAAKAMKLARA